MEKSQSNISINEAFKITSSRGYYQITYTNAVNCNIELQASITGIDSDFETIPNSDTTLSGSGKFTYFVSININFSYMRFVTTSGTYTSLKLNYLTS